MVVGPHNNLGTPLIIIEEFSDENNLLFLLLKYIEVVILRPYNQPRIIPTNNIDLPVRDIPHRQNSHFFAHIPGSPQSIIPIKNALLHETLSSPQTPMLLSNAALFYHLVFLDAIVIGPRLSNVSG